MVCLFRLLKVCIFGALPLIVVFFPYLLFCHVVDACWALSYISEGSPEKIQKVIDAGVCGRLVELLMYVAQQFGKLPAIFPPCSAPPHISLLPLIHLSFRHFRWAVVKPALRTLGNIVTGTDFQTQVVLNAQALPNLLTCLSSPKVSRRRQVAECCIQSSFP